jgi:hypothetical protein
MNLIKELEGQFFEIDNDYSKKEFNARRRGFLKKEAYWRRKRELNTHAYFLFLFTRLEEQIKTESTLLIQEKRSSIMHWKTKAIWENTDDSRLHFKKRLGLLTQKGYTDYNRVVNYFDMRNEIAHGGTITSVTTALNMIAVFADMKHFFKILKR